MKGVIYLLTFCTILSCKSDNNVSEVHFDQKSNYPVNFIKPMTDVTTSIDERTDEIIEILTNFNIKEYHKDCYDENAKPIDGIVQVATKIYVNFDKNNKEISFLQKFDPNCRGVTIYDAIERLYTIPLHKIARIDTLEGIKGGSRGFELTTILIHPKYNSEVIDYKVIRGGFNSKKNHFIYSKDSGRNSSPIIIKTNSNMAYYIKKYLTELKDKNN